MSVVNGQYYYSILLSTSATPRTNIALADPTPIGAARRGQQNVTRKAALRLPPDTAKVRVFGDHEICSYLGLC